MDPKIDHPDNFTYCKNAPSMFFQTPLITFLVKQGVDTVIVTGCTTSGCVRATIVDAFSYGFRVLVPEECCRRPGRAPAPLEPRGRRASLCRRHDRRRRRGVSLEVPVLRFRFVVDKPKP